LTVQLALPILNGMNARTPEPGSVPSAPFDDLDLDSPEDEAEWDRRVMAAVQVDDSSILVGRYSARTAAVSTSS
jgi:hypothetical protein